jgi:hypothetical protein
MIVGFASVSILAGIIASALIARRTAARPDEALAALDRLERRLDEIERLLGER